MNRNNQRKTLSLAVLSVAMLFVTSCGGKTESTTAKTTAAPDTVVSTDNGTQSQAEGNIPSKWADEITADTYFYTYEFYSTTTDKNTTDAMKEAVNGTYLDGHSTNTDYNFISKGGISSAGGCDCYTALDLDGTSYKLTKHIEAKNGKAYVNIYYVFEGTFRKDGNDVILSVPTYATACEELSSGFTQNGIKQNYATKTDSNTDPRILGWFDTMYINYATTAHEQTYTLNDADHSLTYKKTESGQEETSTSETPTTEEPSEEVVTAYTLVSLSYERASSTGSMVTVTIDIKDDYTFTSLNGDGRWYYNKTTGEFVGELVGSTGTVSYDADAKTITISRYSGKSVTAWTLSDDDLTAIASYTKAWNVCEVASSDEAASATIILRHDGAVRINAGQEFGCGTWTVENNALTFTSKSEATGTLTWDASSGKLTWAKGETSFEFKFTDDMLTSLGIQVVVVEAKTADESASLKFKYNGAVRLATSMEFTCGNWAVSDGTLTLTDKSEATGSLSWDAETKTVSWTKGETTLSFTLSDENLTALGL